MGSGGEEALASIVELWSCEGLQSTQSQSCQSSSGPLLPSSVGGTPALNQRKPVSGVWGVKFLPTAGLQLQLSWLPPLRCRGSKLRPQPKLAHPLFLYSSQARDIFYIFK